MKYVLIFLFLSASSIAFGKEYKNFVVRGSVGDEKPSLMRFKVNVPHKIMKGELIWNSGVGHSCNFSVHKKLHWEKDNDYKATLGCTLPGGQEAQATFRCSSHQSFKKAGFFWVGKRGLGTSRNFYVWCE